MELVLLKALAIAAGGMLSFGSILIILLLLSTTNGLRKAFAYFSGYSLSYLLIGIITLLIGARMQVGASDAKGGGSWTSAIIWTLLGGLFLFFGLRKWRNPPKEDAKPPKWLTSLDQMSAPKIFRVGAMVAAINFKNLAIYLSAVSVLLSSGLIFAKNLLLLVVLVLVFCASVLAPILLYLVLKQRANPILQAFKRGLETHNHTVMLFMLLVFGSFFFLRGITSIHALL